MSKGFDYSKWDHIELSDDEEDCHPNIDKESWFRMKHRSRVEREENEEQDKKRIQAEMEKANQRIQVLEHVLAKLAKEKEEVSDDDDDDLDDTEGLKAELKELREANAAHQAKLDEYEKNKKWNVDNLCHVAEERTIINTSAGTRDFTSTGYAKDPLLQQKAAEKTVKEEKKEEATVTTVVDAKPAVKPSAPQEETKKKSMTEPAAGPEPSRTDPGAMITYHEFTQRHADLVEEFMHLESMEESREFLLKHGNVLLQENASNYLLLASLEDEMNGFHEKMKLTARQSQIISSIAELARSLNAHPGNVVIPFFQRMEVPEFRVGFDAGVQDFIKKIERRAVTKRIEMDQEREKESPVDLQDIPREERLGPGGLDPVEVIETLPESLRKAFESREVDQLKAALLELEPEEAERHMKNCIDCGLWVNPEEE